MKRLDKTLTINDSTYTVTIKPIANTSNYVVLLQCDIISTNYIRLFFLIAESIIEFVESNTDFETLQFKAVDNTNSFANRKSLFFTLIGNRVAEITDKIYLLRNTETVIFSRK